VVQTRARVGTTGKEGEGKVKSQTEGRNYVAAVEKGLEEKQWRRRKLRMGVRNCEWY
jgi:hypothetical protein